MNSATKISHAPQDRKLHVTGRIPVTWQQGVQRLAHRLAWGGAPFWLEDGLS